jgi:urate oxidase
MKVSRRGDWHELQNINVKISLEGDFDDIHIKGDNSKCLPTDTMKNTVYALARADRRNRGDREFWVTPGSDTSCGKRTGLERIDRYHRTEIYSYPTGGEPHPHSFTRNDGEKRTASVRMTRDDTSVESGLEDLTVIKTTRSGFAGFKKTSTHFCQKPKDRIFCTSVKANWQYASPEVATEELWNRCAPDDT